MKHMHLLVAWVCGMLLSVGVSAAEEHILSGRVLRNQVGVEDISVDIYSDISDFLTIDQIDNAPNELYHTKTDKEGNFQCRVKNGRYCISVDPYWVEDDYSLIIGPDGNMMPYSVNIAGNDVGGIVCRVYSDREILTANRKNIESGMGGSGLSIPTKWGNVPLQSERVCTLFAAEELDLDISINTIKSERMQEADLGPPVVYYDQNDYPVYYQYPVLIEKKQVEIIGVFAVGLHPTIDCYSIQVADTDDELRRYLAKKEEEVLTYDSYIPHAMKRVMEKKRCPESDVEVLRLLYVNGSFYLLLRMRTTGEKFVSYLLNVSWKLESWADFVRRAESDEGIVYALGYIIQLAREKSVPLLAQ